MRLKERLFHTDLILLIGLFLGVIKTANSLSVIFFLPQWLDSLLTLGMCGCYGLHVLLQKPGIKRLAAYGAAALIGAFSSLRSGDMNGMITLLTCIAMAGCDFDRVIEKLFRWNLAFFLINAGGSILLALTRGPLGPLLHQYGRNDLVVHLGYGQKNIMAIHMISIVFLWIWLHFREIRIKHLIAALAVSTLFLLPNQCKTAYLVAVWMCLMLLYFVLLKRNHDPLVQTAAALGPAALFAFSVICMWLYRLKNPFAIFVSEVMTGRISLCAKAWEQYGLTFFGHLASEVALVENRVHLMDNLYLYTVVQTGALWAIVFCVTFFLLARRTRDVRVHFGILLWALYSMTEITPLNGLMFAPALLPALLLSPKQPEATADP